MRILKLVLLGIGIAIFIFASTVFTVSAYLSYLLKKEKENI